MKPIFRKWPCSHFICTYVTMLHLGTSGPTYQYMYLWMWFSWQYYYPITEISWQHCDPITGVPESLLPHHGDFLMALWPNPSWVSQLCKSSQHLIISATGYPGHWIYCSGSDCWCPMRMCIWQELGHLLTFFIGS